MDSLGKLGIRRALAHRPDWNVFQQAVVLRDTWKHSRYKRGSRMAIHNFLHRDLTIPDRLSAPAPFSASPDSFSALYIEELR